MRLNELFEAASVVIAKKAKENPGGGLKKNGIKMSYEDLSSELKNMAIWCYKGQIDVTKIVRCKNCINYKLYKSKTSIKSKGEYRCQLDKQHKSPDHYCGYGETED